MQQRNVARELGLVVASVAVLVHWLDPRPAVLVTVLIAVAAAAGTGPLVGEWRPWRMPLVPMALPTLAAFAIAGISRVVDPVPWLAFVFLAGWAVAIVRAAHTIDPHPDFGARDGRICASGANSAAIAGPGYHRTAASRDSARFRTIRRCSNAT